MRALGAVGRRHQLHEVGFVGAGDEALDAVDDVVVAVAHRDRAHAARIGAGVGLGLGEAGLQLAAHRRQQILFLHLAFERIQNGAHRRPGNAAHAARRQRNRARQFLLDDRARQHRQFGAAELFRDVHFPEAQILGALREPLIIFRLELLAAFQRRLPLDRDHFAVDKAPQRLLEHAQFFGKFEVHYFFSSRQTTRTSTATAPCWRTMSGLSSISAMRAR